jgi:hypothetical protein
MAARFSRWMLAAIVAVAPLGAASGCGHSRLSAAATKPMSPAEGAGDYKQSPGGPLEKPVVPRPSGEPSAGEITACPPRCNADGSWAGCGLKRPRGEGCQGCTPRCLGKGSSDVGWYDCNGALIVPRRCN